MDPLRIVVRVAFAFVLLLALMRAAGKRTVKNEGPFEFVLSLIIGDMADDVFWAEVPAATFVVAVVTLVALHVSVGLLAFRSTARGEEARP